MSESKTPRNDVLSKQLEGKTLAETSVAFCSLSLELELALAERDELLRELHIELGKWWGVRSLQERIERMLKP